MRTYFRSTTNSGIVVRWGFVMGLCASPVSGDSPNNIDLHMASPLRVAKARDEGFVAKLQLDRPAYQQLKSAEQIVVTDFTIERGRHVDLEMHRLRVFSDDAQVVLGTPEGDVPMPTPDIVLLGGHVAGHPDSTALLGLSPHGSNGFISLEEETFVISAGPHPRAFNAVVYNLSTLPAGAIQWRESECAFDHVASPDPGLLLQASSAFSSTVSQTNDDILAWVIETAVETDWEFTSDLFGGDTDAAAAYAALLIAATNEIYTRQIYTRLEITYLRVWAGPDDVWDFCTNWYPVEDFRLYWFENMTGIPRDIALLFARTDCSFGAQAAWICAICSDEVSYAACDRMTGYFPYPLEDFNAQNWDIKCVAHEGGHLLGLMHTQLMDPPIDGCDLVCAQPPQGTLEVGCSMCPWGVPYPNQWQYMEMRFHERDVEEWIIPCLRDEWSYPLFPSPDRLDCDYFAGAPVVYRETPDLAFCNGGVADIPAYATGSPPLAIQWRKEGVEIPGATQRDLTIDPVTPGDAGDYDVTLTNDLGSVGVGPVTLTVPTCGPPGLIGAGCRYLAIAPPPGEAALLVTSPDYPCLSQYVRQIDHALTDNPWFHTDNPFFLTPEEWGVVYIAGEWLVPGKTYHVQADIGTANDPRLLDPLIATTSCWGDVVGQFDGTEWPPADGTTDFNDICALVEAFRHLPTAPPLKWCDICPAYPDGVIDFNDIAAAVDGFRGFACPFEGPQCP